MKITDVKCLLKQDNPQIPLKIVSLDVLDPKREPYGTMLLQPDGKIEGNENRIGNVDAVVSTVMCREYLQEAVTRQSDLVVAPEYCVPWQVVADIVSGKLRPRQGAIWALGCESITPSELRSLRQQITGSEDVRLLHESFDAKQEAQKKYIDPLLYVFWATDPKGNKVLCLLVQFKTVPCRDAEHVELNALYLGTTVYIFDEGLNRIRLFGIICSDAFNFTDSLVDDHHRNSLILHIQLNPKPTHPDYTQYRNRLFSVGSENHVEVLCVNWAHNVMELKQNGVCENWGNIGGSAWYVPPRKFDAQDTSIDLLHHRGIYHSLVRSYRWNAFYLNYAPQAFVLRKQKVFINGQQRLVQQIGIEVVETLTWNPTLNSWGSSTPNDGFSSVLSDYQNLQNHLPQLCLNSPLAVERALELLEGPDGKAETWFQIGELEALLVEPDESVKRVTVHQQTDNAQPGVKFRRRRLGRAQAAVTLQGQTVPWPPAVKDLKDGFQFRWLPADPHRNIAPNEVNATPATLVYLDENPKLNLIQNLYQKLAQALTSHAAKELAQILSVRSASNDEWNVLNTCKDRLCIVYRRDHRFEVHRPEGYASITQPGGISPVDIGGGGE